MSTLVICGHMTSKNFKVLNRVLNNFVRERRHWLFYMFCLANCEVPDHISKIHTNQPANFATKYLKLPNTQAIPWAFTF